MIHANKTVVNSFVGSVFVVTGLLSPAAEQQLQSQMRLKLARLRKKVSLLRERIRRRLTLIGLLGVGVDAAALHVPLMPLSNSH